MQNELFLKVKLLFHAPVLSVGVGLFMYHFSEILYQECNNAVSLSK